MKKLIYPALFLLLVLASCGKREATEKLKAVNLALAAPVGTANQRPAQVALDKSAKKAEARVGDDAEVSKKIIREGEITFETADVKQTRNAIYNSLVNLGGYISEENETNNGDSSRKDYNLKIRVPAKNFDQFLNGVTSAAAKIESKNIRTTDVTTQYIDYTAQVANKKKLEDRYLQLLGKATKMADMLQIEDKLAEIQTEIESTQRQLNYLVKQVEYSELDITFFSKPPVQNKNNNNSFGYRLVTSLSGGWYILGEIFFSVIAVWPLWIIIGAAIYVFVRIRKNKPQANITA